MGIESLSVVIPTWNGVSLVPDCLDTLYQQAQPLLEVIVADSASTDGTPDLVERDYPAVRLVRMKANRGYTGATNEGIRVASGSLVAVVNQDVVLEPTWSQAILEEAQAFPASGSFATKIMLYDRRDHFHSAGDAFRVDGIPVNRGVWQKDEGQFDAPAEVFAACGGAAVYRRTMLDQVGLLDEGFFMYCEDVDLGWRHQLAGWTARYVPGAVAYHHLGASGGGVLASYYTGRNTIFVLLKDLPGELLRKHGSAILAAQLKISSEALKAWRGAAARARLRGQLAGLLNWPRLIRQRRLIQASRKSAIDRIEGLLQPID
ncbi:MAG TPA: glycosyltransferase family 2 protein [Anaerolineae bacterium]|nr:glycosyltransferase family 2 protein [Anaerolineae bacterium]